MSYLPTQIKSYFKKTDNNSEISEHDSLSIDELLLLSSLLLSKFKILN